MRISDWSSDVCSSDLLGVTLNGVHHLERPGEATARTHADKRFGAGQVVQGVDRETGIVRPRLRNTLTEEVLHLHPHAVGEQIGRGSCRERRWQHAEFSVVAVYLKKKQNKMKHI